MGIPLVQQYRIGRYILEQKLKRNKRYPLVLMLEPLFQCNLACAGCGKIDHPDEILRKRVNVDDALRAVDECGAPVVSIPGGEPLIHHEMPEIVRGIIARKKFVYLCTNALLLARKIDDYEPSPYLTFSIHLDGDRELHLLAPPRRLQGHHLAVDQQPLVPDLVVAGYGDGPPARVGDPRQIGRRQRGCSCSRSRLGNGSRRDHRDFVRIDSLGARFREAG